MYTISMCMMQKKNKIRQHLITPPQCDTDCKTNLCLERFEMSLTSDTTFASKIPSPGLCQAEQKDLRCNLQAQDTEMERTHGNTGPQNRSVENP